MTSATDFLTKANATVEVLTPICEDIKGIFVGAIVEVNGLIGADVDVILANVAGTARVTVVELAGIIGGLICVRQLSLVSSNLVLIIWLACLWRFRLCLVHCRRCRLCCAQRPFRLPLVGPIVLWRMFLR